MPEHFINGRDISKRRLSQSLRVGILCHGSGSGSTRAAIDLALALHRYGVSICLISFGRPRWKLPRDVRHINIPAVGAERPLTSSWSQEEVQSLVAALRKVYLDERLDVLHFHYGIPFAEACRILKYVTPRAAPAIVGTLHGSDVIMAAGETRSSKTLVDALRAADAICTVSHAYAERLDALLFRQDACHVVPNFVPKERRLIRIEKTNAWINPVVTHISNFKPIKMVQHTGQAFIALRRHRPCRLLLLGDGPQRYALRALLRSCGRAVRFLGRQESPLPALAEADVLVITSESESFSLVALEAMTAGIPVVAPRVAGLSEIVIDGEGGLLYTPGRPSDASLKLLRLLNCPALHRRIARAGQLAAQRYSEAQTVEKYLNIFAGALTV